MGDKTQKIGNAAVKAAGVAGALAGQAGVIPSVNDNKASPVVTKEERALASIQDRENKERIKKANKNK